VIQLRGAYTALVTPFTEDGREVDVTRLTRNIDAQSIAGISGVVPCGTTGETPTLEEDEYRLVVERTIDAARPLGLTTIPGAGSNSTAHAVSQHRFVHAAGADAALHVTPYYNRPSPEGLARHFLTIADACPLPVVLYNIPGRTGVGLSIETIERLAAHPNIVAIKEASGSLELAAMIVERTGLTVLSGDDPLTLPLALAGASGVISVLANVRPDQVAALCDAFARGDWDAARALNARLLPLARALLSLDSNPVPVKLAMRLLGLDTGAVRLPLCPAPESAAERLRQLMADLAPEVAGATV
jgi:4-hydroxy-tetrahydrodipicolinate synthase